MYEEMNWLDSTLMKIVWYVCLVDSAFTWKFFFSLCRLVYIFFHDCAMTQSHVALHVYEERKWRNANASQLLIDDKFYLSYCTHNYAI
jgi:hypothetical protein